MMAWTSQHGAIDSVPVDNHHVVIGWISKSYERSRHQAGSQTHWLMSQRPCPLQLLREQRARQHLPNTHARTHCMPGADTRIKDPHALQDEWVKLWNELLLL
eukprot:3888341-Amphidinium_carterae.1